MHKKITTYDIAKKAGVNQSTVSRALSPTACGLICEQQRRKIMRICEQLDYHIPGTRRDTARTGKVGLVLGAMDRDLISFSMDKFITELCTSLQRSRYLLTLIHAEPKDGNYDEAMRRILQFEKVDVYLIDSSMIHGLSKTFLRSLKRPIILLEGLTDVKIPQLSSVSIDMLPALKDVWKRIPPDWYDKIVFCGRDNDTTTWKHKMIEQAAKELKLNKISVKKVLFKNVPRSPVWNLVECNKELYLQRKDEFKNAKLIWCASDFNAFGLLQAAPLLGRTVGKDLFVVSFDNVEAVYPECEEKVLSSVAIGMDILTQQVSEMILSVIEDPVLRKIKVPARYIPRMTFNL